jgi:sulfatase modifying factor 1
MARDAQLEMATVPAGQVTISDRRTQRTWSMQVAPFELAAHPTTQATYARGSDLDPAVTRGEQLPARSASWWSAVIFCNAMSDGEGLTAAYRIDRVAELIEWDHAADGYRLPTEAEWEHACRAGTTGPRYGELDAIAWHRGNSGGRPHGVAGKEPNAWGLYDTIGNVWEWCWDLYDADVYGTYRVLRGGGWFDEHWSCRASVRRRSHPTLEIDDVGFRVARTPGRPGRVD